MKKIVLRFGLYSGLLMLVLGGIQMSRMKTMTADNFAQQELYGYVSIVVALVFVFFAIKYYRDQVNGGLITFGQALKLGLLVTLFPAAGFGFLDTVFTHIINPDFAMHCIKMQEEIIRRSTPPAEVAAKIADMKKMMKTFSNPILGWLVMFFTVFPVGLLISIISALILHRKAVK